MDRAFDYGSKGWGFESLRDRSFFIFLREKKLFNNLFLKKKKTTGINIIYSFIYSKSKKIKRFYRFN